MKPIPSEVISGIRAILKDTIAPELTSDHARSRLTEIRAVLAQIDWDDAGFQLVARTDALADGLRQAQVYTAVAVPGRPDEQSFAAYQEYHRQLSAAATEVLAQLRAARDAGDDDAGRAHLELLRVV